MDMLNENDVGHGENVWDLGALQLLAEKSLGTLWIINTRNPVLLK